MVGVERAAQISDRSSGEGSVMVAPMPDLTTSQVPCCPPCQAALDAMARSEKAGPICDTCVVRVMHNMRVAMWGRDALAPMCEACAGKRASAEVEGP